MKKGKLTFALLALSSLVLGFYVTQNNSEDILFPRATDTAYEINLTSSNAPSVSPDIITEFYENAVATPLGNPIHYEYGQVKSAADQHAFLGLDGYIRNLDAISGIGTITVIYISSTPVSLKAGYTADDFTLTDTLQSGIAYSVSPSMNFFKVIANDDTQIYSIKIDYTCQRRPVEEDALVEAETGLINQNMYRENSLAHGGAYVGAIDNCGQGVQIDFYSYIPGAHDFEIYYTTGSPNSYHNVYVNGEYSAKAVYSVNTGWGAENSYNPSSVTVSINLDEGWNRIAVIKDGISSDNPAYGGWAELDYFVIKGTGNDYVPLESGPVFTSTKLEGELAKVNNSGDAAAYNANASNHYTQGGINATGQGVDIWANIAQAGTYRVQIAYSHTNGDNQSIASIRVNEETIMQTIALPYTGGKAWNDPVLAPDEIEIVLNYGRNHIYVTREDDSNWFTIDCLVLTLIS